MHIDITTPTELPSVSKLISLHVILFVPQYSVLQYLDFALQVQSFIKECFDCQHK